MKFGPKPVRKCRGCALNLRDRCAVFDCPHDMWHNRKRCPGYNNEELIRKFEEEEEKRRQKQQKEKRRFEMKLRQTETHHQGVIHPPRLRVH